MSLGSWVLLAPQLIYQYIWCRDYKLFYKNALQLLRNKNILFTKIFQFLANSTTVGLDPDLRTELQQYTANTSYTESEINYETLDQIEAEYNVQLDRRVINSGMIALVFKGTDDSGKPIIVKLKRRNITQQLQEGCASVMAMYKYASYFCPKNLYVRILRPFITNIDDIIEQCDFSNEIANLRTAKEDFEPLPFVQIPTVYNKRVGSSTDYILMEYIEGTHTLPLDTPDEKRFQIMEQFCTFMSYAFLYNAIQHTDLHSGNFLFTQGGLGIIDYGMAIKPTEDTHDILLSVANMIHEQPPIHTIDFIDTFKDLFVPPLNKATIDNPREVEDLCISIAQPLLEQIEFDELNITDSLAKISALLNHETTLNKDVYKIILGLSMMAGKTSILRPDFSDRTKVHEIERRGLSNAYALIL
jgi:predicted unusual protein kinase regulating ubiquinone biosynthesis (AarF/ABC1/UbiB family)